MIYCKIIGGCFRSTSRIATATVSTSHHTQTRLPSWVSSGGCILPFEKITAKADPSNFRKRMISSSARNNNNRETKETDKTTTTIETSTIDNKWILPTTIHHAYEGEWDRNKRNHNNNNPILLISGWVGTAMDWGAFPKLLSSKTSRDVIVYDPRGMGHARPASTSFVSPAIEDNNSIRKNDVNNNNHFNEKRSEASSSSSLPMTSSPPSSTADKEQDHDPLHDMTLTQMAQDVVAVLNHVSVYYDNSQHGITTESHQHQEQVEDDNNDSTNTSAATATNTSIQKEYEICGVSMGGIIAQMVASSNRGCQVNSSRDVLWEANTKNNHHGKMLCPESWKISSLVLISTTALTSPPVHNNIHNEKDTSLSSSRPTSTQPSNIPPSLSLSCCPEFLKSFDGWLDHHDCHDTLYQTNQKCAKLFFASLGDDFVRRPGRQKLQDKLIDSFLHSRMNMFSTTKASIGISAQRRALQQHYGDTTTSITTTPILASCFQSSTAKNDTNDNTPIHDGSSSSSSGSIPSLIVHGEKDRVMPVTNAYHLEQIWKPKSQLSIVSDGGHLLWITHGRELVEIGGDFYNHLSRS